MNKQAHDSAGTTVTQVAAPRSRRRLMVGALALALVVGAGSAVWLRSHAAARSNAAATAKAPAPALELLPQDIATAALGAVRQSISLTGTLQPLNRSDVKAPMAGQVVAVNAREGDRVRKGQPLVTLDNADLQARLRDRSAALEAGRAQLALARTTRANNQALLRQNFISQAAFDNTESGFKTAEATVTSLQAQAEQARKALADAVVRSPMDGVVAERVAQPGLSVPVNATLMTVQDLSEMELEVLVPTGQIPLVRIGQSAAFSIEGFGERRFEGKVERISPSAAAGARSIAVFVRIANREQQLRGGMFAQGSIVTDSSAQVVVVPEAAVRQKQGAAYALRIDGQTLAEQPLQLGARDSRTGQVEVVSGLRAGDRVVLSGAANLQAGQRVQVLTSSPDAAPVTTASRAARF